MAHDLWADVARLQASADAQVAAGDHAGGLRQSEEALHLAFGHAGANDPRVAACFLHVGRIHEEAGDLTGAEPRYNAASSILNPTEGPATPLKAEVLLAYGALYAKMQVGWRAILLLQHAQARYVELAGPDGDDVGRCEMMLAIAHEQVGLEDEAIAHYDEALRILVPAWGAEHPSVEYVAWGRADLVFWRAAKSGDANGIAQAMAEFAAGLSRLDSRAGRDHPTTATRRATIGTYMVVSGRHAEGADLLQDAIAALDAAGQPSATWCRQLAKARARLGDSAAALGWLRRAIHDDPIGHWVAHGSDRERMTALEKVRRHLAEYLDLVVAAGATDPAIVEEACTLVIARKALGAELLARQRQAVARGDDPELTALLTSLATARAERASASLAGQEARREIAAEIERLEWELASRVPEMDLGPDLASFTHSAVASALPAGSALVEFARFTRHLTQPADDDAIEDGSRDWYVAFVVPSTGDGPRLFDLGSAPEIDRAIARFRRGLAEGATLGPPHRGFTRAPAPDDGWGHAGAMLRARLVDPWRAGIGPHTHVFLAPDGDLATFPFEALPGDDGGYLVDTLEMSYVSAGRDLLRLAEPAPAAADQPLVLADPDYDLPLPAPAAARASASPSGSHPAYGLARFERLPGTREESAAVAALLGVEPLLGAAAREERLKQARSPRVLHIATHGFFLPPPTDEARAGDGPLAAAGRNPLVRSGLVLAGANGWLRGDAPPDDGDDGVVTGEDIVALELQGTALVVLSACETGLGDVVAGEGVMGLRRAFAVAGARTLIVSLWKVPDVQTRMLMTYLYEALLAGRGRAEALRLAQQRVRADHPAPFYWAAFIRQGDPAPLPALRGPGR